MGAILEPEAVDAPVGGTGGSGASASGARGDWTRTPKKWAKETVFGACTVLARLDPSPASPPCVILGYHSHGGESRWGVDAANFERQVAFLSSRFRLVRLADLPHAIRDAGAPVACLTFDDGYLDNYEVTLPVLERFGVKGTFFLISSRLGRSLRKSRREEALMSLDQAREIAQLGHEIGSHTVTHAILTEVPPERAEREVAESKRAIEEMLDLRVTSFAYPGGKFDAGVREMTRRAGYAQAVTTREALLDRDPDWFALPRVSIYRDMGRIQFRAKVSAALDVYNLLRGRRPLQFDRA